MSVAKHLAEAVFGLNRETPVFGRAWDEEIAAFCRTAPDPLARLLSETLRRSAVAVHGDDGLFKRAMIQDVSLMHFLVRWASVGMPAFQLSHSAAAAFSLTDYGSIRVEDFRPPFPTFLVQLPVPWLADDAGEAIHAIAWHEYRVSNERIVSIRAIGANTLPGFYANLGPPSGETLASWPRPLVDDSCFGSDIDVPVLQSLTTTCARLIVSLSLYVATNGRGDPLTGRAKRMRTSARPAERDLAAEPAIWQTGREIKIDRALVRAAADFQAEGRPAPAGWKLRARFSVRGHWRSQAHGPGHSLRRLQWIAPFWKGPKDGVGITHLYTEEEA